MTFLQPHKQKSILNALLVVVAVALVAEVFGMVALYNATVNIGENIAAVKIALDAVGAQNTSLNNKIIAALGSGEASAIAARDGLVQDEKPQYITANQQWPIASQ